MTLRWTWSVPPPMRTDHWSRNWYCASCSRGASAPPRVPYGPSRATQQVAGALHVVRDGQLHDRHLGAGHAALAQRRLGPQAEELEEPDAGVGAGQLLAHAGSSVRPSSRARSTSWLDARCPARRRRSSSARWPGWSGPTPQPPLTSPTTLVGRDAHVGEEHLVEVRVAGDLAQRAGPRCPGCHVDDEVGDARRAWARPGRCGRAGSRSRRGARRRSRPSGRSRPTRRRRARPGCARPARSEPAPGSLKSWHHSSSPRRIGVEVAPPAARRCRGR